MEGFVALIMIVLAIAYWQQVLSGIIGAVIFALIGSIFGETGAGIGMLLGFIGGVSSKNDELKKQTVSSSSNSSSYDTSSYSEPYEEEKTESLPTIGTCRACGGAAEGSRYGNERAWCKTARQYIWTCNQTGPYGCGHVFHLPENYPTSVEYRCPNCGHHDINQHGVLFSDGYYIK